MDGAGGGKRGREPAAYAAGHGELCRQVSRAWSWVHVAWGRQGQRPLHWAAVGGKLVP